MIDQIVQYNKEFVANKGYEQYRTDKYPDKKLAVLSCMDTRLTELLPAALGLKNGDAKIIKNAGGLVISAFDSANAQPHRGHLRAGGEARDGGGPLALRRLPHELRPLPRRDAGTRGDGTDSRHHPQVRHRPQPLARGIQGHTRVRPPHGGDHPHTSPRAEGYRGARLYHRLRDWRSGGNHLNALIR